jgi:hypothetical protein
MSADIVPDVVVNLILSAGVPVAFGRAPFLMPLAIFLRRAE